MNILQEHLATFRAWRAKRQLLSKQAACFHANKTVEQKLVGAGESWMGVITRVWDNHWHCKDCGKDWVSVGAMYSGIEEDYFGRSDGYDLSDVTLWPLDKHGKRLPLASDVRAGRAPWPEWRDPYGVPTTQRVSREKAWETVKAAFPEEAKQHSAKLLIISMCRAF